MRPAVPEPAEISVVIPAHNEAESLPLLLAELRAALDRLDRRAEIVLVDDGSTDATPEVLAREAARDPRLRPVRLEARSGQSAALAAGFARARGAIVVTLDADLQNDPAELPLVLAALDGADVVSGIRVGRTDTRARRLASRIANGARRLALGDSVTDIGCSFKAYRREAIEGLPWFDGAHRFLPALCAFRGARLTEVRLSHRPRRHGRSRYGIADRLGRGLYDLIGVRWLKSRLIRGRVREEER
jgi:glycosyltransferase involved in cell wall biosynthesis